MPLPAALKHKWFEAYCRFIATAEQGEFKYQHQRANAGNPDDIRNYEFRSRIAEGDFGGYYLARYDVFRPEERLCVVKQMRKHTLRERGRDLNAITERLILSCMSSPFVIRYIHRARDSQNLYLVLEHAACGDMTRLFAVNQPNGQKLAERKIVPYVAQIVMALYYIHKCGVTHRCVTPLKSLITDKGRVKLTGFQYATLETDPADFLGDPPYCPPEMYLSRPYGPSVDFWSLGVLIYRVALNELPFPGRLQEEVRETVLTTPPAGIDEIAMSSTLKDLLLKLLEKDPSARLGSGETDALEVFKHPWFSDVIPADTITNLEQPALCKDCLRGPEQQVLCKVCFTDNVEYKYEMPDFDLKPVVQGEPVAANLFADIAPENLAIGWIGWEWF